jgi:hypothetical protein
MDKDYPASAVDSWAQPITDQIIEHGLDHLQLESSITAEPF